ncbi:MAG TPA: hypothetical protein DCF73_13070 [Rhodobiaceae bacterium]|nr:hypothetical protein [Rhodobiaceae bacterium]
MDKDRHALASALMEVCTELLESAHEHAASGQNETITSVEALRCAKQILVLTERTQSVARAAISLAAED